MPTPLKLVDCNIEGSKHFERLLPFLQSQAADVICLQEVFAADVEFLESSLGMTGHFTPILHSDFKNIFGIEPKGDWGLLVLSKTPSVAHGEHYYVGSRAVIPKVDEQNSNSLNRAVAWFDVPHQDQVFRIATTHFTWSIQGAYTTLQGANLETLTHFLRSQLHEFVLCGDFNSPRGGEIYRRLTTWLTDAIPPEITTSIDGDWHRAGQLELMVDYVFTTSNYQAEHTQLHTGVSDHKAITSLISKK